MALMKIPLAVTEEQIKKETNMLIALPYKKRPSQNYVK